MMPMSRFDAGVPEQRLSQALGSLAHEERA